MSLEDILTLEDVENAAEKKLPKGTYMVLKGGALYEDTIKDNYDALKRYKIIPRVLRDVSNRNLSTTILGHTIRCPIGVSPSSLHKLVHDEGEIGTAKACESLGIPMTIAMVSSVLAKDIMKACPSLIAFQQVVMTRPRSLTEKFVREAEKNGLMGIVVTVDYPLYPIKLTEIRNKIDLQTRLERHVRPADEDINQLQNSSFDKLMGVLFSGAITWADITWLKSITHLPVIVKGILTPEDTKEALSRGVDAIWVSNHGGRTLDSAASTIDVLSGIVDTVERKCEVYVDSGFRTGLDVFKGLALGARAVFVGRPVQFGLSIGGEMGVKKVFDILRNELDNTMALAGCRTLADISKAQIKGPYYNANL